MYVPDTNILMYDSESVFKFEEHDVCIPMIVLDELDGLNKKPLKSMKSRLAIRVLDKFLDTVGQKAKSLGENLGKIMSISITPQEAKSYKELGHLDFRRKRENTQYGDNMLIASIIKLKKTYTQYDDIILVTNDITCAMRARDVKITAERYRHEDVKNELYTGMKSLEVQDIGLIRELYKNNYISTDRLNGLSDQLDRYNQCYIIKNQYKSGLARYKFDPRDSEFQKVLQKVEAPKIPTISLYTLNAEQTFAWDLLVDPDIHLVSIEGTAGTGKTLWALLAGCEQVLSGNYANVVVARPDVALSGKKAPWLPGSLRSKTAPLVQPVMDNLKLIISKTKPGSRRRKWLENIETNGHLVVESLTWIRGRTLSNCFLIIDEAENATPAELKTIITRAGEGTKVILTGDTEQVDSPIMDNRSNGLSKVIDIFSATDDPIYGHIKLVRGKRSLLASLGAKIM